MRVVESITIWADNPSKNKDATYSIQILEESDKFFVQAQFGRRGAIQKPALNKGSEYHYEGVSYHEANAVYKDLLNKKRRGGYTKAHATILPVGLTGTSAKPKTKKSHANKLNQFMKNRTPVKSKPFGLEALWNKE